MTLTAQAEMLIRKPVADVFEAFINPDITTQFWFTHSTGRLETDKTVTWTWAMFDASSPVKVKAIEPNRRILIEWDGYKGVETVEWIFTERPVGTTFVSITSAGFTGTLEEIAQQALDATGGFVLVLCGAKALLEHNIRLNLVADRFPDAIK